MNGLDVALVAMAIVAAVGGWRLGFLRRFSAWLGAAGGLAIAIVLAPGLVQRMGLDSDVAVLLVVTALLVLLASIGQGLGSVIGNQLSQEVESPAVRQFDAFGGTLLGILAVAVLAWLVLPVMTGTEGWASESARGSFFADIIATRLPDPPPQIQELEQNLIDGNYPQLFADVRDVPDIPPAPTGSPVSQEMLDEIAPSAVRLQSEACDRIQSGSGFFVGPGLVATNAHVVAGTDGIDLLSADGGRGSGQVIAFDPAVDLALVRTEMDRPALRLAPPDEGEQGLVLGFPGGGTFDPSPFEVGQLIRAKGYDIYDSATVDRDVLALAAALAPGDSGSAVLRDDGAVIGIAVAVAPDQPELAYALDSSELQGLLGESLAGAVGTGRCTD